MRQMAQALRVDSRFTHLLETPKSALLVGDEESVVLEGEAVGQLVQLLDGTRSAAQVASAFADRYPRELTHLTLLKLQGDGLVQEVETSRAQVNVTGFAMRLREAWGRSEQGVSILEDPNNGTLFLTEDYLTPELNRSCQDWLKGRQATGSEDQFTLVRPGRDQVWIGPTLRGGASPCLDCLQARLRLNLTGRALLHRDSHANGTEVRILRLDADLNPALFDVIAREMGRRRPTIDVFDAAGSLLDSHPVPEQPQCPSCGDPSLRHPGPDFTLTERLTVSGSASGLRICTPQDTLLRYSSQVSKLTGVVRLMERIDVPGTNDVHVYTASHAGTYGSPSVKTVRDEARDTSGGKGATDTDARASALCESLERFSALHRGTEPETMSRLSDLGEEAIHPHELLLFSEAQYLTRDSWNQSLSGGFQWVPEPYDNQTIGWSRVRSLVSGETRLVPSAHLYLGYQDAGARYCKGDSNGLAGGNCIEEAILQGFFELVERDSVALWWYNRTEMPEVDLDQIPDQSVTRIRAYYETLDRTVWALDLTSDLGIPCVGAFSSRQDGQSQDIVFGFGCHYDPLVAAMRAITELNQMLPTMLTSPSQREAQLLPEFADAVDWWGSATTEGHPYLTSNGTFSSLLLDGSPATSNVTHVLEQCVRKAHGAGLETFAYDLTRPDVGFAVSKVVVPGARHFWRRTAPGRLYDVPVKMGWVDAPTPEEALNTVSMFV